MFRYLSLIAAPLLLAAVDVYAQSQSQWPSLVAPAAAVANAIVSDQPRAAVMDAMSRLSNAQASLSGPRPQQCMDMMQDAVFTFCRASEPWCRNVNRDHSISQARAAMACYRGERAGAGVAPSGAAADERLRKAQEAGADYYTRVHPGQPRVGDVPGQPYIPRGGSSGSAAGNPCANINLPGCNNGLRY